MSTDENQLHQLQSQLTFQEHELENLHRALYEQQKRIDQLELLVRRQAEQLIELRENSHQAPANQKPPHY